MEGELELDILSGLFQAKPFGDSLAWDHCCALLNTFHEKYTATMLVLVFSSHML